MTTENGLLLDNVKAPTTTSSGTIGTGCMMEKWQHLLSYCRESRKLVLLIVAIGLLLDNMLLTAVGKQLD